MATQTLADPRAWQADTIDAPESWYYPLSGRALTALDHAIRAWRRTALPVTDLHASAELRAACAADAGPVLAALETGRGFAVLTTGQPSHFAPPDLPAVYWL